MSAACAVVGGDTEPVREFITHRKNGLLTPFLQPKTLATTILEVIEDKALNRSLRENARAYAEKRLAMGDYLANYCRVIERLTGENPAPKLDLNPPAIISPAMRTRKSTPAAKPARRLVAANA